jgi:hypothetical protein
MAIGLLYPGKKVRSLFSSYATLKYIEKGHHPGREVSFKHFNGIKTVARLQAEGFYGLSLDCSRLEGRYQIVAVSKERVVILYDSSYPSSPIPALSKGRYRIRLLAQAAEGSFIIRNI